MNVDAAARTAPDTGLLDRLVERGTELLLANQPREALPLLDRAAGLPGAPVAASGLLAEALLGVGRADEAAAAVDRALLGGPRDPQLLLLGARVEQARKRPFAALDRAAEAVMADPRHLDARRFLASTLSEAGRHDEAIFLLHQLVEESPGDPARALWLALAFQRAGRHEAAEELFAHCAGAAPHARGVHALRSENLLTWGKTAEAAEVARQGIALHGPEPGTCTVLGAALHRLGDVAGAAAAFRQAARLAPENAYYGHLASGLDPDAPAERAPDAYVRQLFDHYAERFETSLFALQYRVPGLVLRVLEQLQPDLREGGKLRGDVLDLGCGTGLVGAVLHGSVAGRLVGVDLSEGMLASARAKGCYAELHAAEIGEFLAREDRRFAAVVAADVLCYFGALEDTLAACRARLAPGGRLVFTVEQAERDAGWELSSTARYRHGRSYLSAALADAGLRAEVLRDEALRLESGRAVAGFLVVARAED